MPKQKLKSPGRTADGAADDGRADVPGVASAKARGKRKVRLSGKDRPLKRIDKNKKAARKSVTPAPDMPAAAMVGLPDVPPARRSSRSPPPPKPGRAKLRLGALERLQLAIDEVAHGGRSSLRTRKLQVSGIPKMAQKVVEEAGEVAIEAVLNDRTKLIQETADLFYNVVVLLTAAGIPIDDVWAEMRRRELALGMAEKLPKAVDSEL